MVNVTIQSPTGPGVPAGNGIWVEAAAAYAMVQACNVRVSNSGINAVRIDADNVNFYGENVSLENWHGQRRILYCVTLIFRPLGRGLHPR